MVRVWVKGKFNILADVISRIPHDQHMVHHLPIPDLSVRIMIEQMFLSPKKFSEYFEKVAKDRFGSDAFPSSVPSPKSKIVDDRKQQYDTAINMHQTPCSLERPGTSLVVKLGSALPAELH
jgi:hypothetical protein